MKSTIFKALNICLFIFYCNLASATIYTISIVGFSFSPNTLTINSGDSVMFMNVSTFHPVAQDNGAWQTFTSNTMISSEIQTPGTYNYYCPNHGGVGGVGMSGIITVLAVTPPVPDSVYINEIHYDNTGIDQGEGVEVAGPSGTDLSCYSLLFYNGTDSLEDPATTLTGIIPDFGCGYGVVWFPISGIQNGPSDAIGLHNTCNSNLVQFLSYEGVITAIDGPAAGVTSTDIGVSEVGSAIGTSLQLVGSGISYNDFTWSGPITSTPDLANGGQIFCVGDTIISFVGSEITVNENVGTFTIDLSITNPSISNAFSVDVVYSTGTATLSSDFTFATQTITFPANDSTNKTATITIIDDQLPEINETIVLILQNVSNGVKLGADSVYTITIKGNDIVLAPCSDLFFSEYVEGSSSNKALEVYNPRPDTVNLNNYTLLKRTNGPGTINSYVFNGTLFPGAVFVIVNAGGDSINLLPLADTSSSITFFNGDDALAIINNISGDTIDKIGEWGVDPGINWQVDTGATSNFTLVRKSSIQQGELYWIDGANEWDIFAQDDFSNLGSHSMTPCGPPVAVADFSSNSPVCISDSVCFTDLSIAGAGVINTWFWDFGDGNNNTASSPCHFYGSSGTFNVTLAIVDDSLNTDTFTQTITVTALPIVNAGPSQVVCASINCIALSGSVAGGANTGIWTSSGNGTFSPSNTDLNACYTPNNTDTSLGIISIILTSTNNGSCIALTDSLSISFISGPSISTANMIIDSSSCGNSDGNINGISVLGFSPFLYTWKDDFANIIDSSLNLQLVGSGCYNLTVTDSNNCFSISGPHCIIDAGAPSAPSVSGSGTYCEGDSIADLTATGTGNTLFWFSDPLLTDTIGTGSPFVSGALNTDTFYVAEMGSCLGPASEVIIIIDAAAFVNAGTDILFCEGGNAVLNGLIGGSATASIWSTSGDGNFDDPSLLSATYTPGTTDINTGSVTLTLSSDDPVGICLPASDVITITIAPLPVASFTSSSVNLLVTFSDASTISSGTISGWSWDFGDGNVDLIQNPTNTYSADGSYQACLTVTSDQGCVSTSCDTLNLTNVGIHEFVNNSTVILFPNPSTDGMIDLNFTSDAFKDGSIVVYSICGRTIANHMIENNQTQSLDLSYLNSGVYYIEIRNSFGTITKKVIIL